MRHELERMEAISCGAISIIYLLQHPSNSIDVKKVIVGQLDETAISAAFPKATGQKVIPVAPPSMSEISNEYSTPNGSLCRTKQDPSLCLADRPMFLQLSRSGQDLRKRHEVSDMQRRYTVDYSKQNFLHVGSAYYDNHSYIHRSRSAASDTLPIPTISVEGVEKGYGDGYKEVADDNSEPMMIFVSGNPLLRTSAPEVLQRMGYASFYIL